MNKSAVPAHRLIIDVGTRERYCGSRRTGTLEILWRSRTGTGTGSTP